MIDRRWLMVISAVVVLLIGGCAVEQAATTPPADHREKVSPPPPVSSSRASCYDDTDLAILRVAMAQSAFLVAGLQCQAVNGERAFEPLYKDFVGKFASDIATNNQLLQELGSRRKLSVDVVMTNFVGRSTHRAAIDPDFCTRTRRAFERALDPKVTSLVQLPPPYDLGPEMGIAPCSAR